MKSSWGGTAGTECGFESSVKSFNKAVGLWVKGSCVNVETRSWESMTTL
jgi:hypothetical protein